MNMETEDLINVLGHVPPVRKVLRLNLVALVLVLLSALVTIFWLGLRPELHSIHPPLFFWLKTLVLASVLLLSIRALNAASVPLSAPQKIWPVLLFIAVIIEAVAQEWMTTDHRLILSLFFLPNFTSCLQHVLFYGLVGMAALTIFARHYAPLDAIRCAGYIGLAAAAAGAIGYSIHCPIDSPTFIVVAYGIPAFELWLIGRLALPRLLRW
jgi:hypothetical protein